ncbi:MAG: hypothetical protein MJE68_11870, partial [Proteobacteria bacterium]|nr:hypothetical protein [Pseudomonadota bacterium]
NRWGGGGGGGGPPVWESWALELAINLIGISYLIAQGMITTIAAVLTLITGSIDPVDLLVS